MNKNIIETLIGKKIQEFRVMSFFINSELICDIINLYLKVENEEWYKFTTADGKNNIEKLENEPGLVSLDLINDDFAYPIKTIQNKYINNRILDIKEYLWNGRKDESNGIYIELYNHQ